MTCEYSDATNRHTKALAARVRAAATRLPPDDAHEMLELARSVLHREVDDAVDAEALRWPSPGRVIVRAARYAEMTLPAKPGRGEESV